MSTISSKPLRWEQLDKDDPVRVACEKAVRLAEANYFNMVNRPLEQAKRLADSQEQKNCLDDCQKHVDEVRGIKEEKYLDEVKAALDPSLSLLEITEELDEKVIKALTILQNLISWKEVQKKLKKWESYYKKSMQTRRKKCQDELEEAKKLGRQEKFRLAMDRLREAEKWATSDEKGAVDNIRKKIEEKLSETCHQTLQDVDKLVQHKQPDYSKALKILDEVGQHPLSMKNKAQIEEKTRQIKAKWVDDLSSDFKRLLKHDAKSLLALNQIKKAEEILAQWRAIQLLPEELARLEQQWQSKLEVESTRQELEAHWQAPYLMVNRYEQALSLAREKAQQYADDARFQALLQEAKRRQKEAKRHNNELMVTIAEGSFARLISELERLRDEGQPTLPRYSWKAQRLVLEGEVLADDAITGLKKLACQEADRQAEVYRQQAEELLATDPLQATVSLEKVTEIEFLSEAKQDELLHFWSEIVEPTQERYQHALILVGKAKQWYTKDPLKAWQLYQDAYHLASYAKGVQQAEEDLRPWMVVYLRRQLRQAQAAKWRGDLKKAQKLVQQVIDVIQESESSFDEFLQRAHDLLA